MLYYLYDHNALKEYFSKTTTVQALVRSDAVGNRPTKRVSRTQLQGRLWNTCMCLHRTHWARVFSLLEDVFKSPRIPTRVNCSDLSKTIFILKTSWRRLQGVLRLKMVLERSRQLALILGLHGDLCPAVGLSLIHHGALMLVECYTYVTQGLRVRPGRLPVSVVLVTSSFLRTTGPRGNTLLDIHSVSYT